MKSSINMAVFFFSNMFKVVFIQYFRNPLWQIHEIYNITKLYQTVLIRYLNTQ